MGHVRIPDVSTLQWLAPRDWAAPRTGIDLDVGDVVVVAESDPTTAARMHHAGSETELQLLEVRVPAGMEIEAHAHASDEIIFVLEGELRLGARMVRPGSSVYIPGWTLYGFRAGPDELRFLNFRASNDVSYITKEQFLAGRESDEPGT